MKSTKLLVWATDCEVSMQGKHKPAWLPPYWLEVTCGVVFHWRYGRQSLIYSYMFFAHRFLAHQEDYLAKLRAALDYLHMESWWFDYWKYEDLKKQCSPTKRLSCFNIWRGLSGPTVYLETAIQPFVHDSKWCVFVYIHTDTGNENGNCVGNCYHNTLGNGNGNVNSNIKGIYHFYPYTCITKDASFHMIH